MKNQNISARVDINEYANRVLGMVKIKHGLRNKSEALNKFIELHGEEVLEKDSNEGYVKKIIDVSNRHFKKHGFKEMSLKQLDKLCGV